MIGHEKGQMNVPVAALVLEGKSPEYVRSVLAQQDSAQPFVYLAYLISDSGAGDAAKGVGSFLIGLAKEEVRRLGLRRLCLDCWSGNDRKLVR